MAEKAKKDNKNLIMGICAAIIIIAVVVVALVLATRGSGKIDESYFESDDTKYVLSINPEDLLMNEDEVVPIKSHLVYTYSGNDITSLKSYNEYSDEATAKTAYEYYKNNSGDEDYKYISLNGNYVILTANESEYEGTTAEDIKNQLDFIEAFKNMNIEDADVIETEEVVEE